MTSCKGIRTHVKRLSSAIAESENFMSTVNVSLRLFKL